MSKNLVEQENEVRIQSDEAPQNGEAVQTGGKNVWQKLKAILGTGEQSALLGAAFLMFTSAIGPGFLMQTTTFTEQYRNSFGFVILVVTFISVFAQLNIWQIIAASKMRAQDVANKVLPGLGHIIAFFVSFGGLAFCLAHNAASALAMNILFGLDYKIGSLVIGVIGIIVFTYKSIGVVVDKFCEVTGVFMLITLIYLGVASHPPIGLALKSTFMPTELPLFPVITLVGGTVGGFICFSGGHRLVDAGIVGQKNLRKVGGYATLAIVLTTIVRIMLFVAALSAVVYGYKIDPANPAASVFSYVMGPVGGILFAVLIFSEALNSLVGAAYTSVSFLKTLSKTISNHERGTIVAFIALSTVLFEFIGQPVKVMILSGTLNALILPLALGSMLIAAHRKDIVGDYKHSKFMTAMGWVVVAIAGYMAIRSFTGIPAMWLD